MFINGKKLREDLIETRQQLQVVILISRSIEAII